MEPQLLQSLVQFLKNNSETHSKRGCVFILRIILNDKMKEFITAVLEDVAEKGIEKSITKQNVYEKYKKYCC